MTRKFTLPILLAVGLVSILIGAAIGALIFQTVDDDTSGNDDGNGEVTGGKLILESDSKDIADQVWDPEHHSLIDVDATVKGTVIMIELAVEEEEDQYHFLLLPDRDYLGMINEENVKVLRGAIMVEIMKEDDSILPDLYIGQHLTVIGPHVTDVRDGHGWNEIDPALVITEI